MSNQHYQDMVNQLESQQEEGLDPQMKESPLSQTSSMSQPFQSEPEDTQTFSQTLNYPTRNKRSRYLGKPDPSHPSIKCMEVLPDPENDLPFTSTKIRVGIGGEYLDLQLLNDEHVTRLCNIADGEILDVRACRILGSDCQNIVIFE